MCTWNTSKDVYAKDIQILKNQAAILEILMS